ncbi:5-carboxymethyl-2-hydroxymuconate delta isomerase [Streptomyces sp. ISL-12]|uniref:5-carboxymethyl-2-hydroxymuconate Delta-isomerase n=1 Tax=Streptomyces sp. ISL-12 TaxID=2819177 RepID=UPI001BE4F16F|nr:5-carboxymethyl-2-hydroxymuconate delta isomerase [Streptomyces sp. ISL-12]MBT2410711.1 5-carboxymethyl-2-hydroxymuconate delta isomerase [Streptomyces sp. ISL-12]
MPHLAIDYSAHLADVFDRAALVRELHPLVLEESGSAGVCKTLVRPAETYVGDGAGEGAAFVHVEVGLKPGRSEALKGHLAESILALVGKHLRADDVVLSAEVRELAGSYRLSPAAPRVQRRQTRPAPSASPADSGRLSNTPAVSGHFPRGGLCREVSRSCG